MLTESSIRDKTEALRTVMMRLPWPLGENRNRRLERALYIYEAKKGRAVYFVRLLKHVSGSQHHCHAPLLAVFFEIIL